MRILPFCFLIVVLFLGCNSTNEHQQNDTDNVGQKESQAFTHVITVETEYYTTGPQQSRPPDGEFPAGTKVNIVEEAGSYVLVQSAGGVQAYVATDAVKHH